MEDTLKLNVGLNLICQWFVEQVVIGLRGVVVIGQDIEEGTSENNVNHLGVCRLTPYLHTFFFIQIKKMFKDFDHSPAKLWIPKKERCIYLEEDVYTDKEYRYQWCNKWECGVDPNSCARDLECYHGDGK